MPRAAPAIQLNKSGATLRNVFLPLLCAILAGCSSSTLRPGADDPARVTNSINLSGFPPEYKRGFAAGCEDAKNASGRAARHPKGDAVLVQGWKDGRDYCSPRARR